MINQEEFNNKINLFKTSEENRAPYYNMSKKLIEEGHEVEGISLILATWNFAYFRYQVKDIECKKIESVAKELRLLSAKYRDKDLQIISDDDLEKLKKSIISDFDHISNYEICNNQWKKVGPTGATKLLSIYITKIFIMWDSFIRGECKVKYYKDIANIYNINDKSNKRMYPKYSTNGEGYYDFLQNMRRIFIIENKITHTLPLAKLIDEFNYITISIPIQKELKSEKEKKKREKAKNKTM